jgi:hypothetical protein
MLLIQKELSGGEKEGGDLIEEGCQCGLWILGAEAHQTVSTIEGIEKSSSLTLSGFCLILEDSHYSIDMYSRW